MRPSSASDEIFGGISVDLERMNFNEVGTKRISKEKTAT
jgi:hypothetical protein